MVSDSLHVTLIWTFVNPFETTEKSFDDDTTQNSLLHNTKSPEVGGLIEEICGWDRDTIRTDLVFTNPLLPTGFTELYWSDWAVSGAEGQGQLTVNTNRHNPRAPLANILTRSPLHSPGLLEWSRRPVFFILGSGTKLLIVYFLLCLLCYPSCKWLA